VAVLVAFTHFVASHHVQLVVILAEHEQLEQPQLPRALHRGQGSLELLQGVQLSACGLAQIHVLQLAQQIHMHPQFSLRVLQLLRLDPMNLVVCTLSLSDLLFTYV